MVQTSPLTVIVLGIGRAEHSGGRVRPAASPVGLPGTLKSDGFSTWLKRNWLYSSTCSWTVHFVVAVLVELLELAILARWSGTAHGS